jgi:hypothetical protein
VPGGDLDIAQVHSGVQHGRDEGVAEHVGVGPGDPDPCSGGEAPQAAGGSMAVHPGAAAVEQDRPAGAGASRLVDGACHRWRQRDQDDLGAFPADPQHLVAVFFAEFGDVGAGGFEDPQAEQPEHGHQREVARIRRLAGCGEQGLELQVGEAQVGDSAGTAGRRTCSAGECPSRPSMTQVR